MSDSRKSDVQVVPREALSLTDLHEMLSLSCCTFRVRDTYAWIHDRASFEVYQGTNIPDNPLPYCVGGHTGYLWYGKRWIGIPLRAERDGRVIADMEPRRDIALKAYLQLSNDRNGLLVVIPSFICYEPLYAGETVRLEINNRPIENTTYVVGSDGFLQFQGTRLAWVEPDDTGITICLVTADQKKPVVSYRLYESLERDFLFASASREQILPGHRHCGGNRFVLFHGTGNPIEPGESVTLREASSFGLFKVWNVHWTPDSQKDQPFDLKVGTSRWTFTRPVALSATLSTSCEGPFRPQEPNAAFEAQDIDIRVHLEGQRTEVSEILSRLSLLIEKDQEFLADFAFPELQQTEALSAVAANDEMQVDVPLLLKHLFDQHLIDRYYGSYLWTLVFRPDPSSDLEPVSTLEFLLLPPLHADGIDAEIAEGEEALVTVSCDVPVLAADNDAPSNVLQLACRPKAHYDGKTGYVLAEPVRKTVRLTYPPTKVTLSFFPRLFAIRLLSGGRVRSGLRLSYEEARAGHLAILAPPRSLVRIAAPDWSEELRVDHMGRGRYPLFSLLDKLDKTGNQFSVVCGGTSLFFEILWHASLHFDHEHCRLQVDSTGVGRLWLQFEVDGPPDAEIDFRLVDSRFQSHGQHHFSMAEVRQRKLELPIDCERLRGASVVHCTAVARDKKLDTVPIPCGNVTVEEATEALTEEAHRIAHRIESASAQELLRIAPELDVLEDLGQEDVVKEIVPGLYSARCLDEVYAARDQLSPNEIRRYFRRFQRSMLPDDDSMSVAKLKKACAIQVPKLQLVCAERLIVGNDGAGVEDVIYLMSERAITWDKGIEVLLKNAECSAEMIRDMVRWDDLHQSSDDYIGLMERLAEMFHPAMTRRARAARDWKTAYELKKSGEVIEVKVANWNPNGLNVTLGLITGDVPASELDSRRYDLRGDFGRRRDQLEKLVGRTLSVVVLTIEPRAGTLILSEKRARAKLVGSILTELKEGDTRPGTVTRLLPYGAFVDLGGVDGLIHISELSWHRIDRPEDVIAVGDEVKVYILSVDERSQKVGLSLRRLQPDPVLQRLEEFQIGQTVHAQVTEIDNDGVRVSVEEGLDGFVSLSELSDSHLSHPRQIVKERKRLTLRVLALDREKRRLLLSLKQVGREDLLWGTMGVKLSS